MEAYIQGLFDFAYVIKLTDLEVAGLECIYDHEQNGKKMYFRDIAPSLDLAKHVIDERERLGAFEHVRSTAEVFDVTFRKMYQCEF